ncbi:hypothetical protein ACIA5A_29090 [Micromonospora sp. NPDC051300]|uniref:hypothetical protein n=1 Tax=Micromonospora sp. NPDC051300 TaxID=3364286 RepID=UPI00378A00CB
MIDASGPEEIRAAFTAAIATAGDRVDEIGGVADVLDDAADRYESLQMQASTVAHLREAGRACGIAQVAVATAAEHLRTALGDFDNHDGQVADTVADVGTLASKEILMGEDSTPTMPASTSVGPYATATIDSSTTVGDVLGYADGDTCHGTDRVASAAGPASVLAVLDYGDGGTRWDGGQYVALGTSPGSWNPVTGAEQLAGDVSTATYWPPHLDPAEAQAAAGYLDELAALAEAGPRPSAPSRWGRAAQRLEHLIAGDADLAGERVRIVDDELPVTVTDLLALLREREPAAGPPVRRHVATEAMRDAGGDPGTVWMELVEHDGAVRVAVTGVEGDEDPAAEFWQPYTAVHTPAQARHLAGRLRAFAGAASQVGGPALHLGDGIVLDWSMPTGDGGRRLEVADGYGSSVLLDLTGVQVRELCEALTETLNADDVDDTPNAYWPAANDPRYIDWSDYEHERGVLLQVGDGVDAVTITLSPRQLRTWRDRLTADIDEPR